MIDDNKNVVDRVKSIFKKLTKDSENAMREIARDVGITVEELSDMVMGDLGRGLESDGGFETRWMPVYFSRDQALDNDCQGIALVNMESFHVMCVVPNEVAIGDRELKMYDGDSSLSDAEFRLWEHATIRRHVDPKWPNTFD